MFKRYEFDTGSHCDLDSTSLVDYLDGELGA